MDRADVGVSAKMMQVIKDHFEVEPEVFEVAMYAMSSLAVNDSILKGIISKDTEVRGIPPEAFHLMRRFDNGLTVNKFWLENFGAIKSQLIIDDIKLNTMGSYLAFGETDKEEGARLNALKQARSISLSRFDVLTTIAFLWKGVAFAEKFDGFFRLIVQLSPEHEKYFEDRGI